MPSVKQILKRSIDNTNKIGRRKDGEFVSTHGLSFEVAPFFADGITRYKVGTCKGIYSCDANNYVIIAIVNDKKGNGHMKDVFEWFENSCKRDNKNLQVVELWNDRFMKHLIEKMGFKAIDDLNVIKYLRK